MIGTDSFSEVTALGELVESACTSAGRARAMSVRSLFAPARLIDRLKLLTAGVAVVALIELLMKKPLVPYLSFGDSWFPMIFFGLLAFQSWQLLRFIAAASRSRLDDTQFGLIKAATSPPKSLSGRSMPSPSA